MDGHPEPYTREKEKEWLKNLTRKFFSDLLESESCPPCILFFDHFEKSDRDFREWLETTFIQRILQPTPLVVVLAGQEEPQQVRADWPGQIRFSLQGVSVDCFVQYAEEVQASIPMDKIELIHAVCQGAPGMFINFVNPQ